MTTIVFPTQCSRCKWLLGERPIIINGRFGCRAFPNGIPDDIYLGQFDHAKEHADDSGIQFELAAPAAPREIKVKAAIAKADFVESEHPRDPANGLSQE